jgi:predicted small secreted protein
MRRNRRKRNKPTGVPTCTAIERPAAGRQHFGRPIGGAIRAAGGAADSRNAVGPWRLAAHRSRPDDQVSRLTQRRIITMAMRNTASIALTLLALLATAPLLGACQTTAGAGEDISATGHAITNSAEKHAP